jgi:hypothetical protein
MGIICSIVLKLARERDEEPLAAALGVRPTTLQ